MPDDVCGRRQPVKQIRESQSDQLRASQRIGRETSIPESSISRAIFLILFYFLFFFSLFPIFLAFYLFSLLLFFLYLQHQIVHLEKASFARGASLLHTLGISCRKPHIKPRTRSPPKLIYTSTHQPMLLGPYARDPFGLPGLKTLKPSFRGLDAAIHAKFSVLQAGPSFWAPETRSPRVHGVWRSTEESASFWTYRCYYKIVLVDIFMLGDYTLKILN